MRTYKIFRGLVGLLVFAAVAVTSASGQLAHASAITLGQADNGVATARGIAAISMNPAGLAMPGSGFTLAIVPLQLRTGVDPITAKDIKDAGGTTISAQTKEDWLKRVGDSGGQSGTIGVDVSEIALAMGKIGFQASTVVGGDINLSPDIVQVLLYGNAGRTGQPANISLKGSTATVFAVTTGAVSLGIPLKSASGSTAIGVAVKYSVGNAVLAGRDQGGQITSDPIKVDLKFPVVLPPQDNPELQNGSGIGLDVGFQTKRGKMAFGAAVQNVINTFKWDTSKLVYRPVTVLFDGTTSDSDTDEQPVTNAPAAVLEMIDAMKFKPVVSAGVGYDLSGQFTISGDFRNRLGDGMATEPKMHLGAGAEFRGLRVLHVRGGVAIITGGTEIGGGASLVLGPLLSVSAAGALRKGDQDTQVAQFTLSFGGR